MNNPQSIHTISNHPDFGKDLINTHLGGVEIPNSEFSGMFRSFNRSAFRLEGLPSYNVTGEEVFTNAYARGDLLPPAGLDNWASIIRAATTTGKTFELVRTIPTPLTSYFSMEVEWGYPTYSKAGQSTRFLTQEVYNSLTPGNQRQDFWLFDDSVVVLLNYTADGKPSSKLLLRDPAITEQFVKLKAALISKSLPLDQYLLQFSPKRNG